MSRRLLLSPTDILLAPDDCRQGRCCVSCGFQMRCFSSVDRGLSLLAEEKHGSDGGQCGDDFLLHCVGEEGCFHRRVCHKAAKRQK